MWFMVIYKTLSLTVGHIEKEFEKMSLKIKTTPEIATKLKDAKTFDARLFQPPHSQADKREMQKLLSDLQNGNRAVILIDLGR